jgi:hypothetical protein
MGELGDTLCHLEDAGVVPRGGFGG